MSSSNYPQLGGPNNPANKRKLIESEVDVKELIIIDNGTESVKIGRSGMDYPSIIIPTTAGYPHVISENDVATPKRVYFGKDLRTIIDSKKYNVEYFYPIEHSRIT
jgi:actin-related protein